jgi:DNA-binding NarL/FixJ family response regulator
MMRESLAMLVLGKWPEVGIRLAGSWPEAVTLAAQVPELCILDLAMPGLEPLAGVRAVRAAAPDARVAIVTGSEEDQTLLALLEAGIAGFIGKRLAPALVRAALEVVVAGGRYLPERIAELAMDRGPAAVVTPRQIEVLELMAAGQSNKEIAKALGLSPATVKSHVAMAIAALGATNRTDAVMRASMAGLI